MPMEVYESTAHEWASGTLSTTELVGRMESFSVVFEYLTAADGIHRAITYQAPQTDMSRAQNACSTV